MSTELAAPKTDLKSAMAQIEEIKKGVGDLAIRMSATAIKTQDDYDQAAMLLKEGTLAVKKLKLKRDELVRAPKAYVDAVNDAVKAIVGAIENAASGVKDRGNEFIRKDNARKQAEIAKQAAIREKASEAAVTADTAKDQQKNLQTAAKADARIQTVQAAKVGNAGRRRVFRIVDEALVPREFLVVNESAIRKIQGGVDTPFPTIPGVVFEDVQEMRG
jgi:hypothetical protein